MMRFKSQICLLALFSGLFFSSCGSNSLEDFRQEGQEKLVELTSLLSHIESYADLAAAAPKLTETFNELTELMIAARDYHKQHPREEVPPLTLREENVSLALRDQLIRISQLEGGSELLERIQEPSLHRLDAYEKSL